MGGPILECSLHFRNSRKHFHRCASFGAVDYDIGRKAIFVRFRRFFIVGTQIAVLRQKLPFSRIQTAVLGKNSRFRGDIFVRAIFVELSSLRQKLPFWDKSYRFQDINCRFGDKCRFRDDFFVRAIFGNFFYKILRQFF